MFVRASFARLKSIPSDEIRLESPLRFMAKDDELWKNVERSESIEADARRRKWGGDDKSQFS